MLEHLIGRGQKAGAACFIRSLEISRGLPTSPVNEWNRYVVEVHLSEMSGRAMGDRSLPIATDCFSHQARRLADRVGGLRAYRMTSPY